MDRNTVLAIILSLGVLLAYQFFFAKPAPRPPQETPQGQPAPQGQLVPGQPANLENAPSAAIKPLAEAAVPAEEKIIHVETDFYSATFSSTGAAPRSWVLKTYKEPDGKGVSLLAKGGTPLPLAAGFGGQFSLERANFTVTGGDLVLGRDKPKGQLVFDYSSAGFSMRRIYTFYNGAYNFDLRDEVTGFPDYSITLGREGFGTEPGAKTVRGAHVGPVILSGANRAEIKPQLESVQLYTEDLKWIASEDKYFFAAIVPLTPVTDARAWSENGAPLVAFDVKQPKLEEFMVYAGPKERDRLAALGHGLENIIDFGLFSVIAVPIFWILKKLYSVIGNYGWSIVALTVIIRIPFLPLVAKGQRSMKKMQEIQPRMQEVREKYKKDPQRMQKEMMDLYKKHKVNPMGGCLPMLLQIPVFFALYKVLMVSVELRGAPWIMWIHDLSVKDPYYVLPLVMGATMFLQQKMTPTAGDPRQQKMMMLMPVIFTVMFVNFASGLVLYWLVNNLLSIIQQFHINRSPKTA